MTMLQHGLVPSTGGYRIERSLRFNSADSAYLNRTPASAGNRKTWTWSAWVKRSSLTGTSQVLFGTATAGSNNNACQIRFNGSDKLEVFDYVSAFNFNYVTTQVFRDVGAWYHIVAVLDTTQATSTNRVKVYINGTQVTVFDSSTAPSQNFDGLINSTVAHGIGRGGEYADLYFSGYITEINFIDGSAKTPSDFGETDTDTGVWKPKAYSGSYGTNGFYLKFADNSGTTSTTLGKDSSGNGNNWTPNNFSVTAGAGNDSLVDTPTPYGTDTGAGGEVRGNYCTLNPLDSGTTGMLSNGNLNYNLGVGTNYVSRATIGVSSGKWYCEWQYISGSNSNVGICTAQAALNQYLGQNVYGWIYYINGFKYTNATGTPYGASYTTNDIIGIAFDADAGTLVFYKNGVSQGTAFSGLTSGPYFFAIGSNDTTGIFNFGQRPFAYTAPSGFKALCTQNLPTPTIGATATTRADDYFNTVLYTGTGSSLGVTGVGFQPDWVWIKERSGAADHGLYDAVRGVQKQIESNTTTAETTETTGLTAFNSDGFTVGALAQLNTNTDTYVAWNWKANGAGSSNTAGSITSTVSANTTAGFSVVTFTTPSSFTNATVGHGLGATPAMIITKYRGGTGNWETWHTSLTSTQYVRLNTTAAAVTDSTVFNGRSSTTFTLGSSTWWGGGDFLAYCFAPVAGYSAFGSYTGNGSTDGPFVYTGFRPKFVMIKCTTTSYGWVMLDSARNTYNPENLYLYANLSDAEATFVIADFLSNGFKIKAGATTATNDNGQTFAYVAFAENPFKYSLAR